MASTSDPTQIATQNAAIASALREVIAATESYTRTTTANAGKTSIAEVGEISKSHLALMKTVNKMKDVVYGPVNNVVAHFEESSHSACCRVLLEIGVFDALPVDFSPMSAKSLAAKLDVDEALLARLMRAVLPKLFTEPSTEVYTHNANSIVFLHPALRAGFKMMYDEYAPPMYQMHRYFRANGFKIPPSTSNNPYTFAHATGGLNMWDFLAQDPERFRNFNFAMMAQSAQTELSYGFYPFAKTFEKIGHTEEDDVLLVDVGGGNGQAVKVIRDYASDVKGKMILQDKKEVVADIEAIPKDIEKMAYNFFDPQPVKGALIYYIRRVLHDWPDAECITILKNIAVAMTPGKSRLLVAEIVVPPNGADTEASWMDITMMTFGGQERTEKQWTELLQRAGFRLEKVYEASGTNFSVIEAFLE